VVPEVGIEAPDFTLKNQDGEDVTLSSFRGDRNVLVVFYPFAFSKTCTGELSAIRDDLSSFQNSDVQILAVSTDPADALKGWSQAEGYDFPLLSDFWPHGEVAQAYGVSTTRLEWPCVVRSLSISPAWCVCRGQRFRRGSGPERVAQGARRTNGLTTGRSNADDPLSDRTVESALTLSRT
jgi:peroxiredoxin